MEIICNKGVFGVRKVAVMLSSFVQTQHSLFVADPKGSIRGNVSQGSISFPRGYIGGFFDSSIETTTNMSLSRPDSTLNPVTTSNGMNTLGFGLTHLDVTIHKNNDNRQIITKILRAKLLKFLKVLKLNNFPPKMLRSFVHYRTNFPGFIIPLL